MKRSNFTACLWTVTGVQRQSLPSQPHVELGVKLLSIDEFVVNGRRPALPPDLFAVALVDRFKRQLLFPVDKVKSFWGARFRAKDVTRVPLKLAPGVNSRVCGRCGESRCSCFMRDILATQVNGDDEDVDIDNGTDQTNLAHSLHMTDNITGSADGLLNFFPGDIKPYNIGSKVGLARILAEFYIENHDKGMVKIVNTDVQIYERIIKVTRHRPPFHHVNKCLRLLCSRLYSSSTHVEHRWQESSHGLVRRSEHGIRTSRLTRSCSECSSANSSFSCTSPCSLDSHSSSVRRNCRRMSCCSAGSVSPTLRFEISYWMQSPEWKVATVVPRQGIAIC